MKVPSSCEDPSEALDNLNKTDYKKNITAKMCQQM